MRTQSLPSYEDKPPTPFANRSSTAAQPVTEPVHRSRNVAESFATPRADSTRNINAETRTPRKSTPKRDSKSSTLPRNHKTPEIKITKPTLNQTYPLPSKPTRTSNLRASKFDQKNAAAASDSVRSASTGSMTHTRDYRRSVTPTPSSTSQKRAPLSVPRSKTPDPERMRQSAFDNKRPSKARGAPPSSYRWGIIRELFWPTGSQTFFNCLPLPDDGNTTSKIMLHNRYAIERQNTKTLFTLAIIISLRCTSLTLPHDSTSISILGSVLERHTCKLSHKL